MKILVVIDMQNDFIDGALGTKEAQAIVPKVAEKIKNFDGKVFYTRDTHDEKYLETQEGKNLPVKHCIRGTDGWKLTPEIDVDAILAKVKEIYKNEEINDIDGVKIDFADKWVHLRKSNTEPIIRVYSEASTMEAAEEIGQKIMDVINELAKK